MQDSRLTPSLWWFKVTQIARFMGPTWGPPGSYRPQMAPCWPHEPWCQGMVWRGTSNRPLPEPMITQFTNTSMCQRHTHVSAVLNRWNVDISLIKVSFTGCLPSAGKIIPYTRKFICELFSCGKVFEIIIFMNRDSRENSASTLPISISK